MASGGTEVTFRPIEPVNKSSPCREMERIHIPASDATVAINIINVAITYGVPIAPFFTPEVSGFERLSTTSYSFLITHHDPRSGQTRRLVFDLCRRRNWENYVPSLVNRIKEWVRLARWRFQCRRPTAQGTYSRPVLDQSLRPAEV